VSLNGLRSEFPILERVAYLNAGTDGPVPRAAQEAVAREIASEVDDGRAHSHFERRLALLDELREGYAELLGCAVDDMALTTSTSEGMGKVLAGMDQQLAMDARRMTPQDFRTSAEPKIYAQVMATVRDQEYIAAASEFLNADSKSNADHFAILWKQEQIKAAGGSEQQAREKAIRETGLTLDELTQNTRDPTPLTMAPATVFNDCANPSFG